ncbi:helix-turn-helix domain-containing protein [Corynebacterium auriscanis]|uniref:helix-turn-helix domain-containing protein n=1 Tax=Corynebacterium auriscanis TaxID=99807 RepID=UPI003CEA1AB9
MSQQPHYLTVQETADYLKCSTKTIRNDIANNRYPSVRHGRRYLIDRHQLDNYLTQRG